MVNDVLTDVVAMLLIGLGNALNNGVCDELVNGIYNAVVDVLLTDVLNAVFAMCMYTVLHDGVIVLLSYVMRYCMSY